MTPKTKILVIDDELIVVRSCARILSQEGYDVHTAQSGAEGLQKLGSERFDAVLTDLKMPGVSGLEIMSLVRASYPDTLVIMMTGYTTDAGAAEAMLANPYDLVPKPFTPEELVAAIRKALDKKGKETRASA